MNQPRMPKLPKGAYDQNLDINEVLGPYKAKAEGKTRWCKVHPGGLWYINPETNRFFLKCTIGNRKNEVCIIGD